MMVPAAFYGTAALVIMAPGPDMVLLTSLLLRYRRRGPAFGAAAGMISAGAAYAALSVGGVSLLLHRPVLVTVLRGAGAAILLWYGAQALFRLRVRSAAQPGGTVSRPTARSFGAGFLSTASNPKVGVFLVAFLPQFLPAGRPTTGALSLLAVTYLGLVAGWLTIFIMTIHMVRAVLTRSRVATGLQALTGCVLVVLAVRMLAVA